MTSTFSRDLFEIIGLLAFIYCALICIVNASLAVDGRFLQSVKDWKSYRKDLIVEGGLALLFGAWVITALIRLARCGVA